MKSIKVLNFLPYKRLATYTTLLSDRSLFLWFSNICVVRLWKSKDFLDLVRFLYKYRNKIIRERLQFLRINNQIYAKVGSYIFLLPFPYGINELVETFYEEVYGNFDLSKEMVIDVGAFIGDTTIYFAGKGARVVAFEPLPSMFKIAQENIRMNKLENMVSLRNESIGDRYGRTIINYDESWPSSSSTFFSERCANSYEVKVVSLSEVIFELGQVHLLKMDCEGCELAALSHAYKEGALEQVSHIIVEVHHSLSSILSILRNASFKIVKVRWKGRVCLIYAEKSSTGVNLKNMARKVSQVAKSLDEPFA